MQQFKLQENAPTAISTQSLKTTIPIIVLAVIAGVFISITNTGGFKSSEIYQYLFILPVLLVTMFFSFRKGVKRQRSIYDDYLLTVTEDGIVREQGNTPSITLAFTDVKLFMKNKKGWLIIRGASAANAIIIPPQLEGFEKVEELLNDKCNVQMKAARSNYGTYVGSIAVTGTLALMIAAYTSSNKIVVGISGSLLIVMLVWSFVKIQINKNIDRRTRRSSYFIIIVILSLGGILAYKLFA